MQSSLVKYNTPVLISTAASKDKKGKKGAKAEKGISRQLWKLPFVLVNFSHAIVDLVVSNFNQLVV